MSILLNLMIFLNLFLCRFDKFDNSIAFFVQQRWKTETKIFSLHREYIRNLFTLKQLQHKQNNYHNWTINQLINSALQLSQTNQILLLSEMIIFIDLGSKWYKQVQATDCSFIINVISVFFWSETKSVSSLVFIS